MDSIEENVESASISISAGNEQLRQAERYQVPAVASFTPLWGSFKEINYLKYIFGWYMY